MSFKITKLVVAVAVLSALVFASSQNALAGDWKTVADGNWATPANWQLMARSEKNVPLVN
jgi:hypothetical protein